MCLNPFCLAPIPSPPIKVRPARNKKMFPAGGGFCSAVALSIASAARKQGWKGVGASGGAFAIAEAIAERLRAGGSESTEPAVLSSIAVAPNGFINFGASCVSPCSLVSNHLFFSGSALSSCAFLRHARYSIPSRFLQGSIRLVTNDIALKPYFSPLLLAV